MAPLALWNEYRQHVPPELTKLLGGTLAFGTTCALSTLTQWGAGVSTGSVPPLPTVCGIATVGLASWVSGRFVGGIDGEREEMVIIFEGFQVPRQTLRLCLVGLVAFKVFGGRFWALAPSSYTDLGSFARVSIPATDRYATRAQRATIESLGRKWGCHTCGSRRLFSSGQLFVGDHMPPRAVARQYNRQWWRKLFGKPVQYRFYPQCTSCSSRQGSLLGQAVADLQKERSRFWKRIPDLSHAGGGRHAHCHGFRPRLHHLTGGVIGVVACMDKTEQNEKE